LFSAQAAIALVTLTILEIVLGIDNIIFISVLADKLPEGAAEQGAADRPVAGDDHAHRLLLSISWIMSLTTPIPGVGAYLAWGTGDERPLNWRD
jgi:predicted tellurium resistance membrane protein TerC